VSKIHLTEKGYKKLSKELLHLKTVKRRQISEEIGKARSHGDISENAEYDAAKDAQGFNEKRISEIEDKLSRAQIIDEMLMASDEALIGATVKIRDLDSDDEEVYTLVSETEADSGQARISVTSPVGKALLGHKVGDSVNIDVPAGTLKYKILEITREN